MNGFGVLQATMDSKNLNSEVSEAVTLGAKS